MSKPVCAVVGIGPKNGAAFARRFASEGYAVALMSRKTGYSNEVAGELETARAYACDVKDAGAVESAFGSVRADLGEVDVLIYNAGATAWGTIEELGADDFESSWRINALGAFLAAKQVMPSMLERKAGNIVIVGATASLRGKPFTTAFAPAKAAQRSLAQAMARHLGPSGIHVSLLIIDGGIAMPGEPDATAPKQLDPDHIADTALFLTQQPRSAWTFELDIRPSLETW